MSGTKQGAQKAKATILAKYGGDYFVEMGRIGGKLGHTGGFYADRELARRAGAIGGAKSKRGKKVPTVDIDPPEQKKRFNWGWR